MSTLTNWLTPSLMQSLAWTLLHFLWQGTALAALAAVLMSLCRSASSRYVLAVGALVLMLAAPVSTLFFLLPAGPSVPKGYSPIARAEHLAPVGVVGAAYQSPRQSSALDALPWLVEAWLFGVAFLSLRSAGGFLLLERERRKQSTTPGERKPTFSP